MNKKKKKNTNIEIERMRSRHAIMFNVCSILASNVPKYLGYSIISYFIYKIVDAIAGKATSFNADANINIPFLNSEHFSLQILIMVIIVIFGISGILYGVKQDKLRQNQVKELSKFQIKYEGIFDTNRSSSNIDVTGKTKKGG